MTEKTGINWKIKASEELEDSAVRRWEELNLKIQLQRFSKKNGEISFLLKQWKKQKLESG